MALLGAEFTELGGSDISSYEYFTGTWAARSTFTIPTTKKAKAVTLTFFQSGSTYGITIFATREYPSAFMAYTNGTHYEERADQTVIFNDDSIVFNFSIGSNSLPIGGFVFYD